VVELVLGVHGERRRALIVERAEPRPAGADAAQVRARADHLDHVDGLLDALDRVAGVERHR
jgi:hypothetical protein